MVLEVFSELESKIKKTVDIIVFLKKEIKILKEHHENFNQEMTHAFSLIQNVEKKHNTLKNLHNQWNNKLNDLLKKINKIS